MRHRTAYEAVVIALAVALGGIPHVEAASATFTADFSSTSQRDPATTAVWDTEARHIRLPFTPESWEPIDEFANQRVTAVGFSPAFATDRIAFIGTADGMARSTDGGRVWSRVLTTTHPVVEVALSPAFATDRTGFAVTNGDGVWRSTDGGRTWVKVRVQGGFGVAVSPAFATDQTVFVAHVHAIAKSTDGGESWTMSTAGMDPEVAANGDLRGLALSRDYGTDRTVYATALSTGLYRSTDGGQTWTLTNPTNIPVASAYAVDAGAGGLVATAFLDGVYRSGDRGGAWMSVLAGDVHDVVFPPGDAGTRSLFLATATGVKHWRVGTTGTPDLASGWPGGEALTMGVAGTYPAAGSVIVGRSTGAVQLRRGYRSSAETISTVVTDTALLLARATLRPTVTIPSGTSVTYHLATRVDADGVPIWEGPITPGQAWTFAGAGSALRWRATLASQDATVTPTLTKLAITYEGEPPLTAPTPDGAVPSTSSIRWKFKETTTNATGFEIHAGAHGTPDERTMAAKVGANLVSLDEGTLTPNTEYCDRHAHALRGAQRSAPSTGYGCAVTFAMTPPTPKVSEVTTTSALLRFSGGAGNPADTEYAIREATAERYVGQDGSVGLTMPTWRTISGWGTGTVRLVGLTPKASTTFCVLARNRADVRTACSSSVTVATLAPPTARGSVELSMRSTATPPLTRGSRMPLTVSARNPAASAALDVIVTIPMPRGATPIAGSLRLGEGSLSDARDGDAGTVSAESVTITLGTIAPQAEAVVTIQFTVAEDAGATIAATATARYLPREDLAAVTASAAAFPLSVLPLTAPRPPIVERPPETPLPPPVAPPVVESGPGSPGGAITSVTILEPRDGATLEHGDFTIRGTAAAGQAIDLIVDGQIVATIAVPEGGAFSATIRSIPPGSHVLTARSATSSAAVRITVRAPSTLVITTPSDGEITNARTIVIRGQASIRTRVAFAVDGATAGEVVSDEAGAFAFALPDVLPEGTHALTATTAPTTGPTLQTTRFTVDRTAPPPPALTEVLIVRRVESETVAGALDVTLRITGAFTPEAFADVAEVTITVESTPVTWAFRPTESAWTSETVIPLTAGPHAVRVIARDRAGNTSSQPQVATVIIPPAECGDGMDNDGDGAIDHPADPDCRSVADDREAEDGILTRAVTVVRETTAAIATTTTQVARVTTETAARAAVVVQEHVLDNPVVERATERVVAPAVTVAVVANAATATAATGFQFLTYLQHLLGVVLQPGRLLARRKRKGWGTVYDALSKRPIDLATVRLLDATTGRIVQTDITDHLGRYSFIIQKSGRYRLEVTHPQYAFPSAQLGRRTEDATFVDLNYGEPFDVSDAGALCTANIPLDARAEAPASDARIVRRHYLRILSSAVSNSGLILSMVSFAVSPRPSIAAILAVNMLLYVVFRRLSARVKRPKSWGIVTDAMTNTPLHLAIVRIFDQEFNKLLEGTVTDRYGRYSFLVGRNVYYVTGQKPGYAVAKTSSLDLTKREGVVGIDLKLQPMPRA